MQIRCYRSEGIQNVPRYFQEILYQLVNIGVIGLRLLHVRLALHDIFLPNNKKQKSISFTNAYQVHIKAYENNNIQVL